MKFTDEKHDIESVLFTEEQIQKRVRELGAQLTEEYMDLHPIVACVLKGASFFYTDLCREIKTDIYMDFIAVSSYGVESKSSGVVRFIKDLDRSITGHHILLVEDIIDSGLTLQYLKKLFSSRQPASFKTVCLLEKEGRSLNSFKADYTGFMMPNKFVVGYGLDYADRYRNLPYIGVLKPEVYE